MARIGTGAHEGDGKSGKSLTGSYLRIRWPGPKKCTRMADQAAGIEPLLSASRLDWSDIADVQEASPSLRGRMGLVRLRRRAAVEFESLKK